MTIEDSSDHFDPRHFQKEFKKALDAFDAIQSEVNAQNLDTEQLVERIAQKAKVTKEMAALAIHISSLR